MEPAATERILELLQQLRELERSGLDAERHAAMQRQIREELERATGYGLDVYLRGDSLDAVVVAS